MTPPLSWLDNLAHLLTQANKIPPLELDVSFPWEESSALLSEALGMGELHLAPLSSKWVTSPHLLSGMGKAPIIATLELSPIPTPIQWIFPYEEICILNTLALVAGPDPMRFSSVELSIGFYNFLVLEALRALDQLPFLQSTTCHLFTDKPLRDEPSLYLDVSVTTPLKVLHGRLLCPKSFLQELNAQNLLPKKSFFAADRTQNVELLLHVEIGMTTLDKEEWMSAKVGDFLTLDLCSYDPVTHKGSPTLVAETIPLFRGRFKPEGIKILEYMTHQEEPRIEENTHSLSVTMGSIPLSLESLLHLRPEAHLEWNIPPGGELLLNLKGVPVARGELLKVGEVLGIRISHIGS